MSEHTWLEQVPAFVLGSLEDEEMRTFARHLESCDECLGAIREYRAGLALLTGELAVEAPDPALRDRVLSAAIEARSRADEGGRPADGSRDDSRVGGGGGRSSLPAWLAVAAMFAGALWAALAATRAAAERDDAMADLATVRARVTELLASVANRDSMLALLAAPDVRTSTLAATGTDPQLRLFVRGSGPTVLVTAFGLPSAPSGRTYQLWGIRGSGDPVSIGTFDTDATGSGAALLAIGTEAFDVGAVTEEPTGGSPQPTSQPFLVGRWPGAQPGQ